MAIFHGNVWLWEDTLSKPILEFDQLGKPAGD